MASKKKDEAAIETVEVGPVPATQTIDLDADESAASFEPLEGGDATGELAGLSMLYDLTLPISIELGRTEMTVQEVLALGRGSVVQLERLAGEPVDVLVGERRFAQGEVVVIGEQFGVRITRVIASPVPQAAAR